MKILCECNNIIRDQTDYIPHKAYLIADQDYFDLIDSLDQQIQYLASVIRSALNDDAVIEAAIQHTFRNTRQRISKFAARNVYQCSSCGRIFVDNLDSELQIFEPKDHKAQKGLMRSIEGEKWKGILRGDWKTQLNNSGRGELSWQAGDEQGVNVFENWEVLKQMYFEFFDQFQEKKILRGAFLKKDGEMIHKWES